MSFRFACLASVIALSPGSAAVAEQSFNRIASFATPANMAAGQDTAHETSAEIVDATADGMTLVYTDSPLGVIGRIDITDPANPKPLGNVKLGGEPTSVAIIGNTAFVGVNTSESYANPSGYLGVFDAKSGAEKARCDLGGQPDSVAAAPDGRFVAIAIENERDEDLGDGRTGQMPAGFVVLIDVADETLACDSLRKVDLTGLAEISPEDPEPEYVDINADNEVVVTLQENNHLVLISKAGEVLADFPAGRVTLAEIDTQEEGALVFSDTQEDLPREPDAVTWIGTDHFAIANEGDMDGGTRGWSIFDRAGNVVYDSGNAFERALVEIGHYPEKRSGNKGVEPESIAFAQYGDVPMVFVGSERGSIVGVYDVSNPAAPVLKQLLPSGIAPEGILPIPRRNLLITANEKDEGGPRAHVMIYQLGEGPAKYPQLTSKGTDDLIGWGAISGMAAGEDGTVYAVNDSFYAMQPTIFVIDTKTTPARITDAIRVTPGGRPAQKLDLDLDLEGIALDGRGGFWLASEGNSAKQVPHALYHAAADGAVDKAVPFPAKLLKHDVRFGAEGMTRTGDTLWIAMQREWKDDPKNTTKLVAYNTETGDWGAVLYPKDKVKRGWIGLSDIEAHGDHVYLVQRDNRFSDAKVKQIARVSMDQMVPAALGTDLPVVTKEVVHDLIPDLKANGGYVVDKIEGLAIFPDGTAWVSTDNDGVDDSSGETFFWTIGKLN
ncbi:esterase-like activity of phytase family protein [Chachezhania sediminis]|uniref:esterase-like activity of phytase family protein n=1 Tax=Chachezhania sediminis TaxID=2599291 RepID=UPI00131B2C93|nr:esterase-like activity of phytase family protein [Chachezhania sediminis]